MQITKDNFKENLLKTIQEFTTINNFRFVIVPVVENNVKYNSTDDYIRLWMLNEKNTKNRLFNLEDAINFLTQPNQKYPLWIKVKLIENSKDLLIFELKTSMRFRSPTQLKYLETGHPPFIYEN